MMLFLYIVLADKRISINSLSWPNDKCGELRCIKDSWFHFGLRKKCLALNNSYSVVEYRQVVDWELILNLFSSTLLELVININDASLKL